MDDYELNTIAVLKYALNPVAENKPEGSLSWKEIEKELLAQAVAFLPADVIGELGLSETEKTEYTLLCARNFRVFHKLMQEQAEVKRLLGDMPLVILKGASAAMYYPRPELRQMGDIDALVGPDNYQAAKELLGAAGYRLDADNGRHAGMWAPSGIETEVHSRFSSSDNDRQNEILDGLVLGGLKQRELKEVAGYRVPVLPKLENGIVLLAHINQHLSGGLGLRQIVDWMMYVRSCLDDEFWNREFAAAADAIGMKKLAEVVALLCKRHFGLEGITWCDGAGDELADELLEYIFSKGNFGRKNEKSSNKTLSVFKKFLHPVVAFRFLTSAGMARWKLAQKYRVLKPFAWIYELCHFFKMGLKRKVRPSRFIEEAKQSKRENDLLDRLEVTRK